MARYSSNEPSDTATRGRVTEVLRLLPEYLHNIEDYLALTSVDHFFRLTIQDNTSPHRLLLLCYESRRTFFRPNPLFLLSLLAHPLSLWARRSTENLWQLVEAFSKGEEAVLDLAVHTPAIALEARWSLERIREAWDWRGRVINPLSDLIDKCVGEQWYNIPNFWDGGREDAATLSAEPEETVFRLLIYGELFKDGWDDCINKNFGGDPVAPYAAIPTRLEYVKYLLPDWHTPAITSEGIGGVHSGSDVTCDRPYRPGEIETPPQRLVHSVTGYTRTIHPFRAVKLDQGSVYEQDQALTSEFQTVLIHLLTCSPLWGEITEKLRGLFGGDFGTPRYKHQWDQGSVDWKQGLWENALYLLGMEGMEMVVQTWKGMRAGASAPIKQDGAGWSKLRRQRGVIGGLTGEPEVVKIGGRGTYEAPIFVKDLDVASWDR